MPVVGGLQSVVLDCPDTKVLAEFYGGLLGWQVESAEYDAPDGWVTMTNGGDIKLCFQRVADHHAPRWPDPAAPQQFHLDLKVNDLDKAEQQALGLGAEKAEVQPEPENFRVLLDPAGHPFCLCR